MQPRFRRCGGALSTTELGDLDAAVLEEEATSTVWSAHFGRESGAVAAQEVADHPMQLAEWDRGVLMSREYEEGASRTPAVTGRFPWGSPP